MNAVGGHIRKLRKKAGMTQQTMADRLNVTQQAVSQWENGNTQLDLDTLAAIAGVFGVDITEVIYGEKRRETSGIDPQRRKRYLMGLIVFGALSLAMLALELVFMPYLEHMAQREYTFDYMLYRFYGEPLLYMFIALVALNGCSMVWEIRIKHRMIRMVTLIVAVAFLIYYYESVIAFLGLSMSFCQMRLLKNPVVCFLPGIGLFLGLNGRRMGQEG